MKRLTSIFIVFILVILSSCGSSTEKEKKRYDDVVQKFSDGSYIQYKGGDEYEHFLFDNFSIRWLGSKYVKIKPVNVISVLADSENCYIYRYAFDKNGYIAVHKIDLLYDWVDEEQLLEYEQRIINGQTEYVLKDELLLYSEKNDESIVFESLKELEDYCNGNSIQLSDWYFCRPFGSKTGEKHELINGYSLFYYPFGIQAIQFNDEDVFYGYINDCEIKNTFVSFRLTVCDFNTDAEFPKQVNNGLNIDKQTFGKIRFINNRLCKVYYDKYIVLNTVTGEYAEINRKRQFSN